MKIIECRVLRGPNRHARKPCIEAVLDLEALDEVASNERPGFTARLLEWLPSLEQHECSRGHVGGFVERLHEGTYMGHITEHVMLELQTLAGGEVRFGRTRMIEGRPRHYRLVAAYRVEAVALRALEHAVAMVEAAAGDGLFDMEQALHELKALHEAWAPGPSTAMMTPHTAPATRQARSRSPCSSSSVKTGTNAALSAESATSERSRLGIWLATTNAEYVVEAPKIAAVTISRSRPATRDSAVAALNTRVAARMRRRSPAASFAASARAASARSASDRSASSGSGVASCSTGARVSQARSRDQLGTTTATPRRRAPSLSRWSSVKMPAFAWRAAARYSAS